jgi:hypothetical protein
LSTAFCLAAIQSMFYSNDPSSPHHPLYSDSSDGYSYIHLNIKLYIVTSECRMIIRVASLYCSTGVRLPYKQGIQAILINAKLFMKQLSRPPTCLGYVEVEGKK